MIVRAALLTLASLLVSGVMPVPPHPAAPAADAGKRIYREGVLPSGRPLRGVLPGGTLLAGVAASCAACHRFSGYGGAEGTTVVPPITAAALFGSDLGERADLFRKQFQEDLSVPSWTGVRSPRVRPPYTAATLTTALREGRDPAGRELGPLMPRYGLSDEDAGRLAAYLATLAAVPAPGVEAAAIHFATVIAGYVNPDQRRAMLEVMEAYVRRKAAEIEQRLERPWPPIGHEEALAGGYRRWVLHVWEVTGPAETWNAQLAARYRERPVFAVLGGLGEGDWRPVHDFCEHTGVPCLFPETDLPVASPAGSYALYLSPGLAGEAAALAKHLMEKGPVGKIVQVYRGVAASRVPAGAFRRSFARAGRIVDQVFQPRPSFWADLIERERPDALVLWLGAEDLAGLPALPGPVRQVYFSSALLGEDVHRLPEAWRGRALLTWRFGLPGREDPDAYRVRAWLRARGIEPRHERLQLDAWLAVAAADQALAHLADRFSRDLFVEEIEREAERMANPGVFPRLSLGPGQRFASRGCYLVRPAGGTPGGLEPATGWIVP